MTTVTREHLAGLKLALSEADIDSTESISVGELQRLIAQASAAPEQSANDIRLENCIIDVHGAIQTANGIEHENFTVKEVDGRAIVNLRGLLITERVRSCGCAAPEQEAVMELKPVINRFSESGIVWDVVRPLVIQPPKHLDDTLKLYPHPSAEIERLRAELAEARRNEHNSEVAYKAAIEKQEELRAERDSFQRVGIKAMEKLAEAQALLQRTYDADQAARHEKPYNVSTLVDDIEAFLSASAKPAEVKW